MDARQAIHLLMYRVQKLNEFDEHKIPRGFNIYMLHALKMYKSLIKCSN